MKKLLLLFFLALVFSSSGFAQLKLPFGLNSKKPSDVVNSIFMAAKSEKFDHLYLTCDPNGYSDRDSKRICSITQLADMVNGSNSSEHAKRNLLEFVQIFRDGRITGDVLYEKDGKTMYAKVPIWYDHPQGEDRSNETITLVNRSGRWYLFSF